MSDKHVKRLLIIIMVFGFISVGSVLTGTSYALLERNTKSQDTQVINTGSIKVELTEYYDNLNDVKVLNDDEGIIQENTYDFNIKNKGAIAKYSLYLNDEIPDSYKDKVIDNKYIKVSLEENGKVLGPFNLKQINNELIKDEIINEKELISFKMRIWLDESYENELINNKDSKTYLKLNVKATQDIGENDDENSNTLTKK